MQLVLSNLQSIHKKGESAMQHETNAEIQGIKKSIERLVNSGNVTEAKEILQKYKRVFLEDSSWLCATNAVISILEKNYEEAKDLLYHGLEKSPYNANLLFNLGYVYEQLGNYQLACDYYLDAKFSLNDTEKAVAEEAINKLKKESTSIFVKEKIVFFVKPGMDSFIDDVIKSMQGYYHTKKIVVSEMSQIQKGMEWADLCWFEWCDELIEYGSKLSIAKVKKIVCRIHGYEVYGECIMNTNWNNVDQLIIVAPHIQRIFNERVDLNALKKTKVDLIYCGVNTNNYPFSKKEKGYNLGYLGFFNFKKNLPMTLDIFLQLYNMDSRYQLHLAGQFQDSRTLNYVKYFIREHAIENNVHLEGWRNLEQKNEWFKKINYILISSIDEGLCYAAAEAMLTGIKPILNNCEGLKDHYPAKYIFNTSKEAVNKIINDDYCSEEYRMYIEQNYSLEIQSNKILAVIRGVLGTQ